MEYKIKQFDNEVDFTKCDVMNFIYPWNCAYQPEVHAQVAFVKEKGFAFRMWCFESNPLARYKNPNDPVCTDSCMEMFVNFNPQETDKGYINIETNSIGTVLCSLGVNRHNRVHLLNMGLEHLKTEIKKYNVNGKEVWEANCFVPLDLLLKIYNKTEYKSGDVLKGNFYKCGDDTEIPHYAAWNRVETKVPDYHQPEFFGDLIIE